MLAARYGSKQRHAKDENRLRINVGPSCTTEPLRVEFWPRVSELSTSPWPSTSSSVRASVRWLMWLCALCTSHTLLSEIPGSWGGGTFA